MIYFLALIDLWCRKMPLSAVPWKDHGFDLNGSDNPTFEDSNGVAIATDSAKN